ncbi:hypothetical protein MPER_13112 [Moniliophthora perniciosa FA553]|nr:hypothetical protein MPER_13112 [Moniliophthora perniciosa FA553]
MSSIGPQLPPHLQNLNNNSDDSDLGEEEPTVAGPRIPPQLLKARSESAGPAAPPPAPQDEEDDDDDYTPALPPDLAASRSSGPEAGPSNANRKVQGPTLPSSNPGYDDDDSDDDVGPVPLPPGHERSAEMDGVRQFLEQEEKRRKNIEFLVRLRCYSHAPRNI